MTNWSLGALCFFTAWCRGVCTCPALTQIYLHSLVTSRRPRGTTPPPAMGSASCGLHLFVHVSPPAHGPSLIASATLLSVLWCKGEEVVSALREIKWEMCFLNECIAHPIRSTMSVLNGILPCRWHHYQIYCVLSIYVFHLSSCLIMSNLFLCYLTWSFLHVIISHRISLPWGSNPEPFWLRVGLGHMRHRSCNVNTHGHFSSWCGLMGHADGYVIQGLYMIPRNRFRCRSFYSFKTFKT